MDKDELNRRRREAWNRKSDEEKAAARAKNRARAAARRAQDPELYAEKNRERSAQIMSDRLVDPDVRARTNEYQREYMRAWRAARKST